MSLYNMLHGMNPNTEQLLQILGLTKGSFGRFRDVYTTEDYIVVHTRCGGGNREDYEEVFETVASHPWYSHDQDQEFDSTYADIFFKIPEDESKTVVALLDKGKDPEAQWDRLLKDIS